MNPILATLVGAMAALTAAVFARRTHAEEARWAAVGGAAVALAAGVLVVLWALRAPVAGGLAGGGLAAAGLGDAVGGAWFRADGLTGTLAPTVALAVLALALGLPKHRAGAAGFAQVLGLLAATLLALVAGNLWLLALAELASVALVARAQPPGAGRRVLAGCAALLLAGLAWAALDGTAARALGGGASGPAVALFFLAVCLRLGVLPFSTGLLDALHRGLDLSSVLLALPLGGMVLLARVVHPALASGGLPPGVQLAALAAALLAGLLALSQGGLGRTVGYTIAALHGLLLVGNLDATTVGFLGAEVLWAGTLLAETGLLLVLMLVTARVGPIDVSRYHGLHDEMPRLSVLGLMLTLAAAGLPGSLDFIAEELLLSGDAGHSLGGTLLLTGVIATVGFNLLRVQYRVFYGPPAAPPDNLQVSATLDALRRERLALMLVLGALLAGGVAPGLMPLLAR